jgi:heavy metal translocating P-type ATPase
VVPVDGVLLSLHAVIDEASVTGESLPVDKMQHDAIVSGTVNAGDAFEMRASGSVAESHYQRLVEFVQLAQTKKAPLVRLADQYSLGFVGITFFMAALAWGFSGDPIRALAVLVVATPCPLILATPIAIISGMSRATSWGIMMKHGAALEALSRVRTVVFDKTGTLTLGHPHIETVEVYAEGLSAEAILISAASLDQVSAHILARSLVEEARVRNAKLWFPNQVKEVFGSGIEGMHEGRHFVFGTLAFLESRNIDIEADVREHRDEWQRKGCRAVYLGSEKKLLGAVIFSDPPRQGLKELFASLSFLGVHQIEMLTGDKALIAQRLAKELGLSVVKAECSPKEKAEEIQRLHKTAGPVLMVGDGINDAGALAVADIGMAIGRYGETVSSEAADIVIASDRLEKVKEAIFLSQKTVHIAKRGIWVGMGLSGILMIVALFGWIQPVQGALLQEVVDILVIVQALEVIWFAKPVS